MQTKNSFGLLLLFILQVSLVISQEVKTEKEYITDGHTKYRAADYSGAIQEYTKAINVAPQRVDGYINRANAAEMVGDYEQAVLDLSSAINLNNHIAFYYWYRANNYVSLQNYSSALTDYNKAAELDPTNVDILKSRGKCKALSGNAQGSCEDFQTAKQMSNNNDPEADLLITNSCN